MANIIPSVQQQALFDAVRDPTGDSIILVAVAGAGKTWSLVEATRMMGGSVFLGAYNTKMAKELREKTSGINGVKAATFHSAGFYALRRAIKTIKDPDGKKIDKIVDNFIMTNERYDLKPLAPAVVKCVSMAKQRGIGAICGNDDYLWREMIEHFTLDDDLPFDSEDDYKKAIEQLIPMSRKVLRLSNEWAINHGIIDFDDMVYLPLLMNLRMFQNDWVLIDEAQDTNPTRRALAAKMLKPSGRMVAVGDPRQAIYGFSGADNDALDQIRKTFNAKEMPLTVTYRCPKAVVEIARRYVSHITAHESAPDGQYKEIEYDKVLDHVKPGDAILCRYNKYLINLCFKLIRNGTPARIEGRAIGENLLSLVSKWKVTNLTALTTRVNRWMVRESKKADDKQQEIRAAQIRDRGETVLVLIERALEQGINDVAGFKEMVMSLFDDRVVDKKDMVTLCSVHRSKGLEWPRVFVLGLEELMGRECLMQWQTEQEINLQYVAATRAQELLVNVTGVREEKKQHTTEEA